MKILLVEDTDYKAGHIIGECASHEVIRAVNLFEGMSLLTEENHGFDAIITDWMFPYRADGEIRDNAGERVVLEAQEQELPFIIVSNRETIPEKWKKEWVSGSDLYKIRPWLRKISKAKSGI